MSIQSDTMRKAARGGLGCLVRYLIVGAVIGFIIWGMLDWLKFISYAQTPTPCPCVDGQAIVDSVNSLAEPLWSINNQVQQVNADLGAKIDMLEDRINDLVAVQVTQTNTINALSTISAQQAESLNILVAGQFTNTAEIQTLYQVLTSTLVTLQEVQAEQLVIEDKIAFFNDDFVSFADVYYSAGISNTQAITLSNEYLSAGVGALANLSWSSVVLLVVIVGLIIAEVIVLWLKR